MEETVQILSTGRRSTQKYQLSSVKELQEVVLFVKNLKELRLDGIPSEMLKLVFKPELLLS